MQGWGRLCTLASSTVAKAGRHDFLLVHIQTPGQDCEAWPYQKPHPGPVLREALRLVLLVEKCHLSNEGGALWGN